MVTVLEPKQFKDLQFTRPKDKLTTTPPLWLHDVIYECPLAPLTKDPSPLAQNGYPTNIIKIKTFNTGSKIQIYCLDICN